MLIMTTEPPIQKVGKYVARLKNYKKIEDKSERYFITCRKWWITLWHFRRSSNEYSRYLLKPVHPYQSTTTQDMYVQDICMFMQIEDAIIISHARFSCMHPLVARERSHIRTWDANTTVNLQIRPKVWKLPSKRVKRGKVSWRRAHRRPTFNHPLNRQRAPLSKLFLKTCCSICS